MAEGMGLLSQSCGLLQSYLTFAGDPWKKREGGELQKEMLLGEAGIEGIYLFYLLSTPVPVPHQAMSSLGTEVHSFLALFYLYVKATMHNRQPNSSFTPGTPQAVSRSPFLCSPGSWGLSLKESQAKERKQIKPPWRPSWSNGSLAERRNRDPSGLERIGSRIGSRKEPSFSHEKNFRRIPGLVSRANQKEIPTSQYLFLLYKHRAAQ